VTGARKSAKLAKHAGVVMTDTLSPEPASPASLVTDAADVAAGLAAVQARIAAAARAAGRDPARVQLVAVSKTQSAARIEGALGAGHRVFGENRVQEAQAKWPALRARAADVALHLIGPLQTNKAREALALFDVIETVDRESLAATLAREMAREIGRTGRRPRCLVQVNTGEEAQKAGVAPGEADAFIARCRDVHKLPITGLMCIPPVDDDPALHFALLRTIAERHGLTTLSMGMSADFELAIRFGATHVRVGTAIFGARS
jgi:pyridoxal phosphate enzyme (YggS family)